MDHAVPELGACPFGNIFKASGHRKIKRRQFASERCIIECRRHRPSADRRVRCRKGSGQPIIPVLAVGQQGEKRLSIPWFESILHSTRPIFSLLEANKNRRRPSHILCRRRLLAPLSVETAADRRKAANRAHRHPRGDWLRSYRALAANSSISGFRGLQHISHRS